MITALFLGFLLLEEPVISKTGGTSLSLTLPGTVLEDPDLRRRLFSGLTTTMEFETEIRSGSAPKRVERCFLVVRYDLWEELLLVRAVREGASNQVRSFKSLEAWAAWMRKTPLIVASTAGLDTGLSWKVRTRLRIIPFSKSEARQSRNWFSQVLDVADSAGGEQSRSRRRRIETQRDSNGVFQVLMTTGINRDPVKTFRWRWTLAGDGS